MGSRIHRQTALYGNSRRHWWHPTTLLMLALAAVLMLLGCTHEADRDDAEPRDLRIVSFSPALSRMLVDLGLEQNIVGRTRYCRFLDDSIAVVGDLQIVDYERLIDLNPTHVLIQASRDGADRRLLELCDEHGWTRGQWSSIDTIEDIETVLFELPGVLYESDQPNRVELTGRVAALLNDIALALSPSSTLGWTGPVLLVYNTEPVGVFGRQTYLNDVLVRLGATNLVQGNGWLELTLEDVVQLDPQAIVVLMPGADERADPMAELGPIARLDIAAVRDHRVAVLGHPDSLYPSTGLVGVATELREILAAFAAHEPGP